MNTSKESARRKPFEEVTHHPGWLCFGGGDQGIELPVSMPLEEALRMLHQRGLRDVLPKGLRLRLYAPDVELDRPRHRLRSRPARRKKDIRRDIEEPVRLMRSPQLGEPPLLSAPVKGRCRQRRSHHVVGMRIHAAIPAEGQHHLRRKRRILSTSPLAARENSTNSSRPS